jgi:hypothetical protein
MTGDQLQYLGGNSLLLGSLVQLKVALPIPLGLLCPGLPGREFYFVNRDRALTLLLSLLALVTLVSLEFLLVDQAAAEQLVL